MEKLVIIGSGCAGMGAAIYAARGGLSPLVIEGTQPGGQITTTSMVENFPGFADGIDGFGLVWSMRSQAEKFGARIVNAVVEDVDFSGSAKKIFCSGGQVFEAEKVVIATGASSKMIGAKNEMELFGGKGVSTCATCDGAFYRGKDVVIVGGGDSACEEAVFLTKFASSVKLIHRRDELRASKIMAGRIMQNEKITPVWNSVVKEILIGSDGKCAGVKVENVKDGSVSEIPCSGVFVAIGHKPNTNVFSGKVDMDEEGYIKPKSGTFVCTNVENVFVAGDCSDKRYRQAITAAALGAMAGIEATR
ncbi:MAG: thioredoxin-disulfide reductase [Opitutales bacterium]|nr:thioredoxin-disulfide reductase [Opitutales bacterium]